jgi:hypothetical protein
MATKEISSSLPNESNFFHWPIANDVNLFKPLGIKPIIKGNWASSSTRVRMNNMNKLFARYNDLIWTSQWQFFMYSLDTRK